MKSATEYKMAFVRWLDAKSTSNYWATIDNISEFKPSVIDSIGWVIEDNEYKLMLATSIGHHNFGGLIAIPRKAVTDMYYLDWKQD